MAKVKKTLLKTYWSSFKSCLKPEFIKKVLLTEKYLDPVSWFLLFVELFVCLFVVQRVNYTEIDWKAYMQEVEGFLNGTTDYSLLKGDTGPLVYPAGFVYIYSLLYYITDHGQNLRFAQYIYIALYLIMLYLVFRIYRRTKKVPAYILFFMCFTSYRIHSIFLLRLFNDPIAMILLYLSINLFLDDKWSLGSLFYSLAVSVKMNVLLFSPALLLTYLTNLGIFQTIKQLSICGIVQLILGLPFLINNPLSYLKGSFDLGRVFLHQWTVNWRFLPEDSFTNKNFHLALLTAHISMLLVFYSLAQSYLYNYSTLKTVESDLKNQKKTSKKNLPKLDMSINSRLLILPLFLANFIGIVFSRSLHYQFYVWYYHTIPYLLWCTNLSISSKLTLLGLIELAWNTYPSTSYSSLILHIAHIIILKGVYQAMKSSVTVPKQELQKQKD